MSAKRNKRVLSEESSEESEYNSDASYAKRTKSEDIPDVSLAKDDVLNKISNAFVRTLIGFSSHNQILNKTMITKILESENEKGSHLKFRKDILPRIDEILKSTFNYELSELPSKSNLKISKGKNDKDNKDNNNKNSKLPSEEFILTNRLPESLRALNYKFLADKAMPINNLQSMNIGKDCCNSTTMFGPGLPRPTNGLVQKGFTLLILCIVVLNGNHINQLDLIGILKDKFHLNWKENENVDMLGHQTLGSFLTQLGREEYLERQLITDDTNSKARKRQVNSLNAKFEDNLVSISIGKRCLVEWNRDEFINVFRQVMNDQWDDELEKSALFTVNDIWEE